MNPLEIANHFEIAKEEAAAYANSMKYKMVYPVAVSANDEFQQWKPNWGPVLVLGLSECELDIDRNMVFVHWRVLPILSKTKVLPQNVRECKNALIVGQTFILAESKLIRGPKGWFDTKTGYEKRATREMLRFDTI